MRDGWKYKKLEECAEIQYGTRVVQKRDGGTIYPVYGGGGETFRMDSFNRENCLIVARFAMSKCCVRYVSGKFFLNDSGLSVKAGEGLCQEYLNHHILYLNDDIYNLGKGAAQRNLEVKAFKQLKIAIPPQSVQLEIVAELDQINDLIRLKKEQLKDYDDLAQSIFYEMFGDPVENEKGWEVKKLGDICEVSSSKRIVVADMVAEGIPFLRGTELMELSRLRFFEKGTYTLFITEEQYNQVKKITGVPRKGDILIPSINSEGRTWIVDTNLPFYFKDGRVIWVHQNETVFTSLFLSYVLQSLIRHVYHQLSGATFLELKLITLRNMQVPLPPLPLQQEFATRISQIEQLKSEVQKTITDLETLLASRMQYWFE